MQIEWLDQALDDFDEAIARIDELNPQAARKFAKIIHLHIQQLHQMPLIGRRGRVEDTRELVIPGTHFIIPYRFDGHHLIELLAVMHDAREWPEKFDSPE